MLGKGRVAWNDGPDDGAQMQPPGDEGSTLTPPAQMSDEEIDQELLSLGERWNEINDPNNSMAAERLPEVGRGDCRHPRGETGGDPQALPDDGGRACPVASGGARLVRRHG